MRVAHLLRCEGDLVGAAADDCVAAVLAAVRESHDSPCAAVVVDLTQTCRFSTAVVPQLRQLRRDALAVGVVLQVLVRPGSAADRALAFHLGLGEALPTVVQVAEGDLSD